MTEARSTNYRKLKVAGLLLASTFAIPLSLAQEQVHFTGETSADARLARDALNSIADYIRQSANCPTVGDVKSEILPDESIKRDPNQPEGTAPAIYEKWVVTSCGKSQSFLVVFWAGADGGTMFRVQLKPAQVVTGKTISGDEISEDVCQILASTKGAKAEMMDAPGVHALGHTASNTLELPVSADVEIKGLVCWRTAARLAPGDYLVPDKLGIPLFIKTDTGDAKKDRTITLEKAGGSPRVRMLSGPDWTEVEEEEVKQAIQTYLKSGVLP